MTAEEESGNEEMSSAQESLAEAEKSGSLRSRAAFQNLLQVSWIVPSSCNCSLAFASQRPDNRVLFCTQAY